MIRPINDVFVVVVVVGMVKREKRKSEKRNVNFEPNTPKQHEKGTPGKKTAFAQQPALKQIQMQIPKGK